MLTLKGFINKSIESTCMDRNHSHVHMFSDEDIKRGLKLLNVIIWPN